MSTVVFQRHGTVCTVRFGYDAALVDLIKAAVPSYARSWHASTKEWTVAAEYADQLASAIRQLGHRVIGLDPPNINGHNNDDPAQWACDLFRRVGPTRRDPVFRALSRVLHPDNQQTGDSNSPSWPPTIKPATTRPTLPMITLETARSNVTVVPMCQAADP